LGATHLRAIKVRTGREGIEIVSRTRLKVNEKNPKAVCRIIARALEKAGGPGQTVGVAAAAQLSADSRMVLNSPNYGWRNFDFATMLEETLGTRVIVDNDINAAAVAEAEYGAGRGFKSVLTVLLGSGIGAGLVLDGNLYRGATGVAGEIGHVKIRGPRSRRCGCGQRGCLEAYVGGINLAARLREDLERGVDSSLQEMFRDDPSRISTALMEKAALSGDRYAKRIWGQVAGMLGDSLANAVTVLNPDVLILGGGGFLHCPHLRDHVGTRVKERALSACGLVLNVRTAELGDDAGALGAAFLADKEHGVKLKRRYV